MLMFTIIKVIGLFIEEVQRILIQFKGNQILINLKIHNMNKSAIFLEIIMMNSLSNNNFN